jgi:hypothetical protein
MLVQQRTSHILSFQGLYNREKGSKFSSNEIKRLREENIETLFEDGYVCLSAQANISLIGSLTEKIKQLETAVLGCMGVLPEFVKLKTVTGVGDILALTISLETGDIRRFPKVGNYSSYCRCVSSQRFSNEKKKGENNRKNGNKYLSWAFVEAANFARRYCPYAKSFYNRKLSKTNKIVAIKALAHKLARASYFVMRDRVDYDPIPLDMVWYRSFFGALPSAKGNLLPQSIWVSGAESSATNRSKITGAKEHPTLTYRSYCNRNFNFMEVYPLDNSLLMGVPISDPTGINDVPSVFIRGK